MSLEKLKGMMCPIVLGAWDGDSQRAPCGRYRVGVASGL